MRLVATFDNRDEARRYYAHLTDEGISALFEMDGNIFQVWVHDEEDIEQAKEILEEFRKDPHSDKYDVIDDVHAAQPSDPVEISEDPIFLARMKELKLKMGAKNVYSNIKASITKLTILLCAILFVFGMYQRYEIVKEKKELPKVATFTPVDRALMFDTPNVSDEELVEHDGSKKSDVEKAITQNVWIGLYNIALEWPMSKPALDAPKFVKIREGQVWRIFTPALLHGGILHILFNMLWVWLLGKQIEERVGKLKYIVLMLIIGSIANIAQYVMIGPNFLGFSGIVCGMAGFIWMRQRNAPWEGYPLHYTAVLFLAIFVLGIAALQVVSFFLNLFGLASLPIQLANTAHLVGALMGIVLAKMPYFARKRHER